MIEQGLFKKHFVGRDGFIWWIGQVVSAKEWEANTPGNPTATNNDHKGFDYRYKVRIMGYHTASQADLPDNDLPWASVMLPVTAGSGAGCASQTPNIKQGSFVYGFFLDGEDAQQPIIMGMVGYNQYTPILGKAPTDVGFKPFSGYNNKSDIVPTYSILSAPNQNQVAQTTGTTQPTKNGTVDQSNVGLGGNQKHISDDIERDDAKVKTPLYNTSRCKPIPAGEITIAIREAIQSIQNAKKAVYSWRENFTTKLIKEDGKEYGLEEYIQLKINKAAERISSAMKTTVSDIQKYITRKINNGMKDVYFLLFPDKQQTAKEGIDTAMDLLACLFKRIIKNLLKMVRDFLFSIYERYINVPLCAVQSFVSALIGKLMGLIMSAVQAILEPLNAILGVVDLIGGILDFVVDVLSFLNCEEEPSCANKDEWSLDGNIGPELNIDVNSVINQVKGFASSVSQSINPDNFNFDLDFSDVLQDTCNVGALFCGPPNVVFFGGGGGGTTGNAIISVAGEVLGVDITNTGNGYARTPLIQLDDPCGKGNGGLLRAIMGPVSRQSDGTYQSDPNGDDTGVVGVVVERPGFEYLPTNDGSQGGDGRVWAEANQTTVQRSDGTYDIPYNPGTVIDLFPGDIVRIPPGTNIGNIIGGTYNVITDNTTITAPDYTAQAPYKSGIAGDYPYDGNERYPVISYLCDVSISNRGFGYSQGDTIVVEPSYGAVLEPVIDNLGRIIDVNIISSGEGFKEYPSIFIDSSTGSNAVILPRFCIDRIGEDKFKEPGVRDKVVSVVDCVGKN